MISKDECLSFRSQQRVQYSHWTFMQLIPESVKLYVFKYALVLCQRSGTITFFILCALIFFHHKSDAGTDTAHFNVSAALWEQ